MKRTNLLTFFTKHRRTISCSVLFACMFFVLGFENTVFAANTGKGGWEETIVTFVNGGLKFVALFLALMTYLVSLFLSPEWMNGSLFGIQGYLKTIWIMVSNIVYIVFALILIGIAFMNIVGVGQDKFQLKQSLPKFIVGILIVPFSWFLVNFVLSLASVLSVIAINLPFDSFKGYENNLSNLTLPTKCTIDMTGKTSAEKERELEVTKYFFCDSESPVQRTGNSSETIYLVVALYTYGIMGIDTTDMLKDDFFTHGKDLIDILVKVVFDLLFFVVYALLIIALGMVLMIRGFNLWIYIMFSPVFGLMYFFGKSSGGSGFFEKFNIKEFLALAMVPVYSMLALSFGMLFLYIVGQGMTTSSLNYDNTGVQLTKATQETGAETLQIGEFALTFVGPLSSTWGNIGDATEDIASGLQVGGGLVLGTLGTLILKIMGIVVLWGTMMAALKSSKITAAIVEPLDQFGKNVGQIVTQAPQYTPIPGVGQSFQSLNQLGNMAKQHYTVDRSNKISSDFADKYGLFGRAGAKEYLEVQKQIGQAIAGDKATTAKNFESLLRATKGNFHDLYQKGYGQETLFQLLQKSGNADVLKKYKINSASDINDANNVVKLIQEGIYDDTTIRQNLTNKNAEPINDIGDLDKHYHPVDSTEGPTAPVYEKHTLGTSEIRVHKDKDENIIDIRVDRPADIIKLADGLFTSGTADVANKKIYVSEEEFKRELKDKVSDLDNDTIDRIIDKIEGRDFVFDPSGKTPPPPGA